MNYIISTDRSVLESWQTLVDEKLGYPEPFEDLHNVGLGPWAPKELGQAKHYASIIAHPDGGSYALPTEGQATSTHTLSGVVASGAPIKGGKIGEEQAQLIPSPVYGVKTELTEIVDLPEGDIMNELPEDWYPKAVNDE